ncbi:MAG: hypothetical protein CVU72_02035 [Deltaproteobacteria bacterium HGW-Deltaproteobacteria-7]|nr:MAG: hypothetical protein CVU72_02035 [Deltaproteobacteria bacterium HGW-Deltaproteobacteria-7]PKN20489.1 MAG: hypothetical protein CVU71_01475 [Deltaproteobacteria bacterium HGW-Deltaproteobacteria-6]
MSDEKLSSAGQKGHREKCYEKNREKCYEKPGRIMINKQIAANSNNLIIKASSILKISRCGKLKYGNASLKEIIF